jgi:hypothetical protein
MAVFGRLHGSPRELLVLVVADEPRGKEKYGSKVAGPAAVSILREALGLTVMGQEPLPEALPGFAPASDDGRADGASAPGVLGSLQPWSEVPGQPVPAAWSADRELGAELADGLGEGRW